MENKKIENSLQKLTVSELIKSEIISKTDFDSLSKEDRTELITIMNGTFHDSKGKKKDEVLNQMSEIMTNDTKNALWENNHEIILQEMHNYIINYGRMPVMKSLEDKTNLSRQTITKHLKEYKESELFKDYKEQYKMLHSKVLDVVYKISMTGDIKACKLFLEATGEMIKASTYIDKQQNNHTENNFNEPFDIKKLITFTKTKD